MTGAPTFLFRRVPLEIVAAGHAALMVLVATWGFGGNAAWVQTVLSGLGLSGLLVTGFTLTARVRGRRPLPFAMVWLLPLLGFTVLVAASTLSPSLLSMVVEGTTVLVPQVQSAFKPSSAVPAIAWRELALYSALFIPAFNLVLAVQRRRTLRQLFLFFAVNAVVLAVFGTLQKLSNSGGLYFGAVASPNTTFFASFIYHNHWGAFALLAIAVTAGLVFDHSSRCTSRDFFHSPAFSGVWGIVVVLITLPLSSSRSCTILGVILLSPIIAHAARNVHRSRLQGRTGRRVATVALVGTLLAAVVVTSFLAAPVIRQRAEDTRQQLTSMREKGSIGSRAQLYQDTWRMASDRLLFGWGLGSYGTVFSLYNTQQGADRLPQHYEDAHSDWLQGMAETGVAGTALRITLVLLPALTILRLRRHLSAITAYPLLGCGLLAAYAWVEFPYGNAAVVLCSWILLFACTRYLMLSRERSVA